MKIEICGKHYTLKQEKESSSTVLATLFQIKLEQNRTLAFRSGCKSGVCGSCAVVINGVEKLACKTPISDQDRIEPLKNSPILKDLVVSLDTQKHFLEQSHAFLEKRSQMQATQENIEKIDRESNCILCSSCLSACPIYPINQNFIGPFALARNYRYIEDEKEQNLQEKIDAIQSDGVWDCTLCGNCNMVCPSAIDIKGDIEKLRNKSAQFGYNNPNMMSSFDTGLDFGTPDFGFNPNGF